MNLISKLAVLTFISFLTIPYAMSEDSLIGLHDDSEAGIVISAGNANSNSFNFKQSNTYGWGMNLVRLNAKYLQTDSNSVQTALYWILGLRYERELSDHFSLFLGQNEESDRFSGYYQRYNSDLGGKYFIYKEEGFYWNTEAGYRYTVENRVAGQVNQSYLRFFTEANRDWTKTFSTKLWFEYLPNLSDSSDYQLNTQLSASAAINDVFAIKTGYAVKYRNILIAPAVVNTDTEFTTALVAKF